jgi:LmbE family N-acetylglucosaminyl deacetylase
MKIFSWTLRRATVVITAACCLSVAPCATAQFPPALGTGPGLAETVEAIDGARVTTRILYVTAHPDDESAAVLTYLARGLHADVALLSITRGEGGQNALGPEQAPQLGLIRTQELLAATRGYGVKLYFTRAKDFGYSKTPEETEKVWGDQVLEDMVRVIRTFRPNIVINHWGGVHGGHGHHQASGLLTPKAVQLAADANFKLANSPLSMANDGPWGDREPVRVLDFDRGDPQTGYVLLLDDVSPLWGKSWRGIGLDSFVNHRTQGIATFLNSPFLRRPVALVPEGDAKFDPKNLAVPLRSSFPGCPAFEEADDELVAGRTAALNLDWYNAARSLALAADKATHWLDKCPFRLAAGLAQDDQVADMNRSVTRIEKALALAAGLQVTAEADRSELVAGESFAVQAQARCRLMTCIMGDLKLVFRGDFKETKREGDLGQGLRLTVSVPPAAPSATPEVDRLQPEPHPLFVAQHQVTINGYILQFTVPVTRIQATSTRVDRVPLRIVPAYTLAVEPKQAIEILAKQRKAFDILLKVHSYATQPGKINVGLDVPQGWRSTPPVAIAFSGAGDQYAKLTVTPSDKIAPGSYTIAAYAQRGDEKFTTSVEPLPSMPTQLWEEPAQCIVHAFDVNVPDNLRIGYVTAEEEPIPEALQRLGIYVETLDAQALAFSDLSKYDAIVVGVRAYELRPELPGANQRLLDYVSNGGTLVVQYNRDFVWDKLQPGPYPAKIGSPTPRITDENSPVKFLKPDDALLNRPNKITQDDFKGWVQERGLYFWNLFDAKYTPLLAMNDPGENDLNGAVVYTRYGKGTYIYTGIAFFRQLPEGVPGAYRLFVNLLSASRGH